MQTKTQLVRGGVDFVFMLMFNIGGQMLAMVAWRLQDAPSLCAASLLLSVSRRYLLRRWFNTLLRIGRVNRGPSRSWKC